MDLNLSPRAEAFRQEVKTWLQANLPEGWGTSGYRQPQTEEEQFAFRQAWHHKLYEAGLMGITWPDEYGGRGLSPVEQAVFYEEMARVRAPHGLNAMALNLAGPVLIEFGTEAQKQRFLPKILSGEEVWCQGFSEPNAGSDLASLRTTAIRQGEHFSVNGQKTWTSGAEHADWCFMLVRTDSAAPKHKGISFLLVDMRTPGITVRPIVQITGNTEFAEVFCEEVRVPAENLVGDLNKGWALAMSTLGHERGPMTLWRQVNCRNDLSDLLDLVRTAQIGGRAAADDPAIRARIGRLYTEAEILRFHGYRVISNQIRGKDGGVEGSVAKLHWSELHQRLGRLATEVAGLAAQAGGDGRLTRWMDTYLVSLSETIFAGTTQVQKNIIAERGLGLPREPRYAPHGPASS